MDLFHLGRWVLLPSLHGRGREVEAARRADAEQGSGTACLSCPQDACCPPPCPHAQVVGREARRLGGRSHP